MEDYYYLKLQVNLFRVRVSLIIYRTHLVSLRRSFQDLSGINNSLLGKTSERKMGQRKLEKKKTYLDRAFFKMLHRLTPLV